MQQDLARMLVLQREINIRKARESLWAFCCMVSPDFYKSDRWHLWLMCETLQALYERRLTKKLFWDLCHSPNVPSWYPDHVVEWDKIVDGRVYTNLMQNISPRFGKSRTLTNFCDWILGKDNQNKIITVSYNNDLAADMSRFVRDGIMMKKNLPADIVFSDIFPKTMVAKGNSSFMKWALDGCFFNYLGAGLEGTLTGRGGNCLAEGTIIKTEIGNVPIELMCSCNIPIKVLSYDIENKNLSYESVQVSKESYANEFIKITTSGGKSITCTPEHRIYSGNGTYRDVSSFRKGETVYAIEEQEEQNVRYLWKPERWKRVDVQKLLSKNKKQICKINLQTMRERICQRKMRLRQIDKARTRRLLLLIRMFSSRSCYQKQPFLYSLRKKIRTSCKKILFVRMPKNKLCKSTKITQHNMSDMWHRVSSCKQFCDLLLEKMLKSCALKVHGWIREPELQRWQELCKTIQRNAKSCVRKRWFRLRGVWEKGNDNRIYESWEANKENRLKATPSRRKYCKQRPGEHGNIMFSMPSTNPQIKKETVVEIRRYCTEKQPVYDIQVENTHNMFAGEILLSNCTIIDDPIKSAEESYNERVLDGIWSWYTGTFLSRSEKGGEGSIDIINHTRWNTKDLCGRIMDGKMGPDWFKFAVPVEYGGNLTCPGILPQKDFETLKENMDPNIFRANYYQEPVDVKGRLFEQILTYDKLPDNIEKRISYCDTADSGDDYLINICGGVKDGEGFITDVYFTLEPMTITEPETAKRIYENKVDHAKIESNNGGKGFARNVERIIWEKYKTKQINVSWFHQSENKMARILTGATFVMKHVYLPKDWMKRWPDFYLAIMSFQKAGGNKHDDAAEGIVEWGKMITGDGSINSFIEMMKKMKEKR
jgi:predicted phage terminase large subunit-like protein